MQSVSGVRIFLILLKAFRSISTFASQSIRQSQLGDSDFRVLEVLLHKGAMPVNMIGPKVFLTPGSISVAVDRLYERGFVTRVDSTEDRRIRMVGLTPPGRKLIKRIFSRHARQLEQLTSVLTETERMQLADILKKLGRHAAAQLAKGV
jgi:MarR family 2-MHQ and catechol resistance regulon transcriptional repressor